MIKMCARAYFNPQNFVFNFIRNSSKSCAHTQQFQIKENARRGSSSLLDRLAEGEEFRGRKSQFVAQMIPRSGKSEGLAICAAARASAVEKKPFVPPLENPETGTLSLAGSRAGASGLVDLGSKPSVSSPFCGHVSPSRFCGGEL